MGRHFTFYTRTVDPPPVVFPDRLQVRMSTNGASTDVGTTATSVGDFTTLWLDINPNYEPEGYPRVWTQFTVNLSGIPGGSTLGRLAFRYFVENGGPNGANSDYIGIDRAVYTGGSIQHQRQQLHPRQLQQQRQRRPQRQLRLQRQLRHLLRHRIPTVTPTATPTATPSATPRPRPTPGPSATPRGTPPRP